MREGARHRNESYQDHSRVTALLGLLRSRKGERPVKNVHERINFRQSLPSPETDEFGEREIKL